MSLRCAIAVFVAACLTVPFETLLAAEPKLALRDGDRVALIGGTFFERDRFYGTFEMMLRNRFPGVKFSLRNLAWPGDTTTVQLRPLNFGSFEDHLTRFAPTVALVSYGTSEAFPGTSTTDEFIAGYRKLLETIEKAGAKTIVLVAPNRHEKLGPPFPDPAAHNKNLKGIVDATLALGKERGLPTADLFRRLPSTLSMAIILPLTENGLHLSPPGYAVAAENVALELRLPKIDWNIELAAGEALPGETRGPAEIPALKIAHLSPEGVDFSATEPAVPVVAPDNDLAGAPVYFAQRTLAVSGLAPGRYVLVCDGEELLSASAEDWSRGVPLENDLACDQARKMQREIVRKDLLFFHRWRAHNGEYIYGRRSKAGDGNAGNPTFPAEMAEFDRLLAEADERLAELSRPVTRHYELKPE